MKMAKASEADLNMAMDVANVLDDIERGYFPSTLIVGEEADSENVEWIDTADREQYQRLIYGLKLLLNQGSISRVIWGMAVVCDPANECIDPDADTIEHHPKRQQLEKQVEELEKQRDRLSDLCDTWNSECDDYRADNRDLSNKLTEALAQRDELLEALVGLSEVIDEPPERNCSCNISPPCNDCVEYSGVRDALNVARSAIASVKGGAA